MCNMVVIDMAGISYRWVCLCNMVEIDMTVLSNK